MVGLQPGKTEPARRVRFGGRPTSQNRDVGPLGRGILGLTMLPQRRVREVRGCGGIVLVALLLAVGVLVGTVAAQDEGIPTLRVYTDLVQIPTLVLDSDRQPIPDVAERSFIVRIDGGPPFHVTHVRMEGDDPIALSVLLDLHAMGTSELMKSPEALAELAPSSLHPVDAVSVYALDCQLVRTVADQPATPTVLEKAARVALSTLRDGNKARRKEACHDRWNLLDAVFAMSNHLAQQRARRVILVFTDGSDGGSRATWDLVRQAAQMTGVAIFAIVPPGEGVLRAHNPQSGTFAGWEPTAGVRDLNSLCEASGGMILEESAGTLTGRLEHFISLVRGRYILDFPRPATSAGMHRLEVSIDKVSAFIRPAGAAFPLADPELEKERNVVVPDPSKAPQVGTKRQNH